MTTVVEQARALIQAGKKADAQKLLEPYLQGNVKDVDAWLLEAGTWPEDRKARILEMALKNNPDDPRLMQALGQPVPQLVEPVVAATPPAAPIPAKAAPTPAQKRAAEQKVAKIVAQTAAPARPVVRKYRWLSFCGGWLKFIGVLIVVGAILGFLGLVVGAFLSLGSNSGSTFLTSIGIGIGTLLSGVTTGSVMWASSDAIDAFVDLAHSSQETARLLGQWVEKQ